MKTYVPKVDRVQQQIITGTKKEEIKTIDMNKEKWRENLAIFSSMTERNLLIHPV